VEAKMMEQRSSHNQSCILIVDDEADIALTLKDLLEGEGYHTHVASSGQLALTILKRESIDTVLLDVCLPDIDGLLILENLSQSFPGLPVIIVSGLPRLDQVAGPLDQLGAFAHLRKPIERAQVKTTVRQAVKAHKLVKQMKRTQQALMDSELRFQAIFQTAADAIVLADGEGRITGWNRAAELMFGYSENEVFGRPLTLLMPIRYHESHIQGLKRVSQSGETKVLGKTVRVHGKRRDGAEFPIELSLNAWASGTQPSYSGFIRDLSEGSVTIPTTSQPEGIQP